MRPTRRQCQVALGVIWLLCAALQYQPFMFSRQFGSQALYPAGDGSPIWISGPLHWSADLTADHRILLNAVYATIQLLIALGLFWRRTATASLLFSLPWVLAVWWLGEGVGGLFAGAASPLMGYPGAVILYGVAAVLLLPSRSDSVVDSVAEGSPLGRLGSGTVWVLLWGGAVVEMLVPADRTHDAVGSMVVGMGGGEPHWLASVNSSVGNAFLGHSDLIAFLVAAAMVLIAVAPFTPPAFARSGLVLAVVLALGIWVVGQDFGMIFTGTATDPNTGPLLVLLAAIYWPGRVSAPARRTMSSTALRRSADYSRITA